MQQKIKVRLLKDHLKDKADKELEVYPEAARYMLKVGLAELVTDMRVMDEAIPFQKEKLDELYSRFGKEKKEITPTQEKNDNAGPNPEKRRGRKPKEGKIIPLDEPKKKAK